MIVGKRQLAKIRSRNCGTNLENRRVRRGGNKFKNPIPMAIGTKPKTKNPPMKTLFLKLHHERSDSDSYQNPMK